MPSIGLKISAGNRGLMVAVDQKIRSAEGLSSSVQHSPSADVGRAKKPGMPQAPKQLIDRRALITKLANMATVDQAHLVALLKAANEKGRAEVHRRFKVDLQSGIQSALDMGYLTDQILRTAMDAISQYIHPVANPTAGERISIVAIGGYGRGELAPFSDIDILFLVPGKMVPWLENIIESLLYLMWDLGLKVGQAVRTPADVIRTAGDDLNFKTAFLEARLIWGDRQLFKQTYQTYQTEIVEGNGRAFTDQKLAERTERHKKLGDSRYQVEPNVKDGKGGLRDIQTIWWISRFVDGTTILSDLKTQKVLRTSEYRRLKRSLSFLWSVRFAVHYIRGRADERLAFDMQRELAERFGYRTNADTSAVERFMKHYFRVAKDVGDLTRIYSAALEARQQKTPMFAALRRRRHGPFMALAGRLSVIDTKSFDDNPALMLKIFRLADELGQDVHPETLRSIRSRLKLIDDSVRDDPEAQADFLAMLSSQNNAENTLRRLNEAGVFGQFIPDFGRVMSLMQFDMYHHYTVDEHTIRAIGLLADVEAGRLADEHPITSRVIHQVASRRVLYMAVLLHDIAKGRGGDHSELGADIALDLCPRFNFTKAETETVAWLVKYHLLMSDIAFKRDLSDPKTIQDFCALVKSPERLRLLICLTVVDIRAVGPGTWNGWKGQLLTELFEAAEETLVAGHQVRGRAERVAAAKMALVPHMASWPAAQRDHMLESLDDSYWISEDADTQAQNASLVHRVYAATNDQTDDQAEKAGADIARNDYAISVNRDCAPGSTHVAFYGPDRPGTMARLTGALALAGAYIVNAKIHTTNDHMALENFHIRAADGGLFDEPRAISRLKQQIAGNLAAPPQLITRLSAPNVLPSRSDSFEIEPVVLVDNHSSNRSTVIEVNAKDRTGLLHALVFALYRLDLSIYSAHVATYGERAVDVFYVRDRDGNKVLENLHVIEQTLIAAVDPTGGAA